MSVMSSVELEWPAVERQLDESGFALTPPLLSAEQCAELIGMFDDDARFRSTVVMARHAFGEGSYRYFSDPLPPLVQRLRTDLYPPIARIANRWAEHLGERRFPLNLDSSRVACSTSARPSASSSPHRCCCATRQAGTTACTRTSTATSPSRSSSWSC